jgi:transposase
MARQHRRRFSREFKIEAVELARREGVPLSQVARDLGIGENLLRRWRTQFEADPTHAFGGSGRVAPRDAEVLELKRELARVRRERDFLKNAAAFFAKESR